MVHATVGIHAVDSPVEKGCDGRHVGDATLAWIAACRASGDPVPEPTTKARRAA
jgi:hypothetical protein